MSEQIRLDVPATLQSLSTVRRVLGGLGARLGYSLDDLDDLFLATDELLRRAFSQEGQDRVHLEALVGDDGLELTLGTFASESLRDEVSTKIEACDSVDLCRLLNRTMNEVRVEDVADGTFEVVLVRRRSITG